jgi:hypothetical protein
VGRLIRRIAKKASDAGLFCAEGESRPRLSSASASSGWPPPRGSARHLARGTSLRRSTLTANEAAHSPYSKKGQRCWSFLCRGRESNSPRQPLQGCALPLSYLGVSFIAPKRTDQNLSKIPVNGQGVNDGYFLSIFRPVMTMRSRAPIRSSAKSFIVSLTPNCASCWFVFMKKSLMNS